MHTIAQPGPVKLIFQCHSYLLVPALQSVVITFSRLGINRIWLPILRSQMIREIEFSLSSFAPECLVLQVSFGRPRVSLLILHTQAEPGAYLRDSTRPKCFPRRLQLEPPRTIGLVSSLSGYAIALPMAFTTENQLAQGQKLSRWLNKR